MCLLRTWAKNGKTPGQANRNDVPIKWSCDKLPFYNQQCSDMDSVTQGHELKGRGYSPVHTCVNTTLKKHSITVKTWILITIQQHIITFVTSPPTTLQEKNFQASECLCLITWYSGCNHLISMLVDCSCCGSSELRLFFCLFLNFSYLLPLRWWCTDLHTQNDFTNFWLSQRSHIHTENYDINIFSHNTQSINLKIFQDSQVIIDKYRVKKKTVFTAII